MNWVDFFLLGVLAISAGFGAVRGMFKEVLSLLTWLSAYIVAQSFYLAFDTLLIPVMEDVPSIRKPLAWGTLFVCTILIGSLLQRIVNELVRVTGLSGSDRALGAVFGLLRGVVIIVLLLTFLPLLIDFSQDGWWQASILIPIFEALQNTVMNTISAVLHLVQGAKIEY